MRSVSTCDQIKGRFFSTHKAKRRKTHQESFQTHATCVLLQGLIPNILTHLAPCFPDFPLRFLHRCSLSELTGVSVGSGSCGGPRACVNATNGDVWIYLKSVSVGDSCTNTLLKDILGALFSSSSYNMSQVLRDSKMNLHIKSKYPPGSCEEEKKNCSLERRARVFSFV
ncbi:hypothetical protein CHARACLAT_015525 [Characodon lateralis]|uniref:Uncharacterized protein n=1 Tax=Characodon lateralis TaxID=208331 RepID=A0ABU7CRX5_9TELE|nr:hypothetical protein [Characodon lateralis]